MRLLFGIAIERVQHLDQDIPVRLRRALVPLLQDVVEFVLLIRYEVPVRKRHGVLLKATAGQKDRRVMDPADPGVLHRVSARPRQAVCIAQSCCILAASGQNFSRDCIQLDINVAMLQ